jgi:hypothetical protein
VCSGRAYLAAGQLGRALKRFLKVHAHFDDFREDQFDFHSYCVRKMVRGRGRAGLAGEQAQGPKNISRCLLCLSADRPVHAWFACDNMVSAMLQCGAASVGCRVAAMLTVSPLQPTAARFPALPPQTLRAYVGMLRMEDRLLGHPTYLKGIAGAVAAYLRLHDAPSNGSADDEDAAVAGMSAEEARRWAPAAAAGLLGGCC